MIIHVHTFSLSTIVYSLLDHILLLLTGQFKEVMQFAKCLVGTYNICLVGCVY